MSEMKLKRILEELDPSRTIDPIERQINHAFAKYTRSTNTVSSVDECHQVLSDLVWIGRNAAANTPNNPVDNSGINYSQAIGFLQNEIPDQTEWAVRDIMITGAEGGIRFIINVLAREMAMEYSRNLVMAKATEFWDGLTVDEQVNMPDHYLKLCGDILPKHIREEGKYHLARFWEVLMQHPQMVKQYRDRF